MIAINELITEEELNKKLKRLKKVKEYLLDDIKKKYPNGKPDKVFGYVYIVLNKKNGKMYVGQTTRSFEERYNGDFFKYNKNVSMDYFKYGREGFMVNKKFFECYDQYDLDYIENSLIKIFETNKFSSGYNRTKGNKSYNNITYKKNRYIVSKNNKRYYTETK